MDGSRIRNKTVSFSFENGVVWAGFFKRPKQQQTTTTTTTFISYLKVTQSFTIFLKVDTGRSEFSELIESDCHYVTDYNLCRSHKGNDTHYIRITKHR